MITYKVNGVETSKESADWFFGKDVVDAATNLAIQSKVLDNNGVYKCFQKYTGFLTVIAD